EHATRGKSGVGVVGAHLDGDVAADPVRTTDPAHHQQRHRSPVRGRSVPVGVDDVDPQALPTDGAHHGAQRGRGAAAPADDLAQVVGMHVHLQGAPAAAGHHVDPDVLVVLHDAADQVVQDVLQPGHAGQLSSAGADAAPAASDVSADPAV